MSEVSKSSNSGGVNSDLNSSCSSSSPLINGSKASASSGSNFAISSDVEFVDLELEHEDEYQEEEEQMDYEGSEEGQSNQSNEQRVHKSASNSPAKSNSDDDDDNDEHIEDVTFDESTRIQDPQFEQLIKSFRSLIPKSSYLFMYSKPRLSLASPSSTRKRSPSVVSGTPPPPPHQEGRDSDELSLLWLIGNLAEMYSAKTIFKKFKNLKAVAIKRDIRVLLEKLADHIPMIVNPESLATAQKFNINSFNKFYKIGILIYGLATILNLQLASFKIYLDATFARLRNRNAPTTTCNIETTIPAKTVLRPTEISNYDESQQFYNVSLEFGRLELETPPIEPSEANDGQTGRRIGPRFGQDVLFSEEPDVPQDLRAQISDIDRPTASQNARKKATKKKRRHRETIVQEENEIITILNDATLPSAQERIERNDFLDRSAIPPRSEMPPLFDPSLPSDFIPMHDEIRIENMEKQQPAEQISPVGKTASKRNVPPAPKKLVGQSSSLVLEPLDPDNSKGQIKSPRRKKRRLQFLDEKCKLSLQELRGNIVSDDENRLPVLHDPSGEKWVRGLSMIENCGRKLISNKLKGITKEYLSYPKPTATPEDAETFREAITLDGNQSIQSTGSINKTIDKSSSLFPDLPVEPHQADRVPDFLDMNQYPEEQINIDLPIPDFDQPILVPQVVEENQVDSEIPAKTFDHILRCNKKGRVPTRRDVAHKFGILLRMQAEHKVILTQEVAYGPITVQQISKSY